MENTTCRLDKWLDSQTIIKLPITLEFNLSVIIGEYFGFL